MTAIRNCVRKSMKPDGPAKILSFFWDGNFDLHLTNTGHEFYGIPTTAALGWKPRVPEEDYHKNLTLLPASFGSSKHALEFDFILCNERIKGYDLAKNFSHALHVPLVIVDHGAPLKQFSATDTQVLKESRWAVGYVGCNEVAVKEWEDDILIEECVCHIEPAEERPINVLLAGKFIEHEHGIVNSIASGIENCLIKGENEGLSEDFASWEETATDFSESKIFVHLSTNMTVPRTLKLAMEAGCAIITTRTTPIDALLKHDESAIFIKNADEIVPAVKGLLSHDSKRIELGEAAKKISRQRFGIDKFTASWSQFIEQIRSEIYLR